jgi:hypothetical protein
MRKRYGLLPLQTVHAAGTRPLAGAPLEVARVAPGCPVGERLIKMLCILRRSRLPESRRVVQSTSVHFGGQFGSWPVTPTMPNSLPVRGLILFWIHANTAHRTRPCPTGIAWPSPILARGCLATKLANQAGHNGLSRPYPCAGFFGRPVPALFRSAPGLVTARSISCTSRHRPATAPLLWCSRPR